MLANYHTHTVRCGHAFGTEREYVEEAIRGGLKTLGFSDHTPMPYDGDYAASYKMPMSALEGYVDTVLALKDEYRAEIDIRLGLEVEYYPAYFEKLCRITDEYPIEYFLLGQHFLGNEIGEPFSGSPNDSAADLVRYREQTLEGLDTGRFLYFAHPDVFFFTGDPAIYEREMRLLCEGAKERDIPLEINMLGIETNRHYPNPLFWRIAGEVGNRAVLGADAHRPENVTNPAAEAAARALAAKNRIEVIELTLPEAAR